MSQRTFKDLPKQRLQKLLSDIGKRWKVTDDGGLTTTDFGVVFVESALIQLIDHTAYGVEAVEVDSSARKALRETVKSGTLTAEALQERFFAALEDVIATPLKAFTVATKNHFRFSDLANVSLSIAGTSLQITSSPPSGFDLSPFFVNGYGDVDPNSKLTGCYSFFEVRARSPDSALHVASETFSLLYGALNFWHNLGRLTHRLGRVEPVAELFPGSEAIFFDENKIRQDSIIYWPMTPHSVKLLTGEQLKRLEEIPKLLKKLERKDRAAQLYYYNFFKLYFQAISEAEEDTRLIRLWKVAEYLTQAEGGADRTAKRLAAVWKDRDVVESVLEAIQHRRNWIVHRPTSRPSSENIDEYLRRALDEFVWFSLSVKFETHKSWKTFLDVVEKPIDIDELERAIDLIKSMSASTSDAGSKN